MGNASENSKGMDKEKGTSMTLTDLRKQFFERFCDIDKHHISWLRSCEEVWSWFEERLKSKCINCDEERSSRKGYQLEAFKLRDGEQKDKKKIASLEAELSEWQDDVKGIMAEPCDDESVVHCTCVPTLRRELKSKDERIKELERGLQ